MIACVPVAAQLLGSRVTSDILEALEFLAVCQQFGLQGAHDGLRKALALVWSSETSVKTAVTNVYVRLYLTPDETASSQQQVTDVVRNLLSLVSGATVGELTSSRGTTSLADEGWQGLQACSADASRHCCWSCSLFH